MATLNNRLTAEVLRLHGGLTSDIKPGGVGSVRFIIRCPMGAIDVLDKAKQVLITLDEGQLNGWPDIAVWRHLLPSWFVEACPKALTKSEADFRLAKWRKLSTGDQIQAEREAEWPLEDWLYWMQPENRQWFWWDAKTIPEIDHILLAVEVDEWPFPWGALHWLFRAAGASAVESEA